MRKTLKIAAREYKVAVRSKAFVVMIVLMPVLMGGGGIAMALLDDRVDTGDKRIAVVDHSGNVAPAIVAAAEARNKTELFDHEQNRKVKPAYLIEVVRPDEDNPAARRLELSNRVRAEELHAFVEIGRDVAQPGADESSARVTYHSKNAILDDARSWIAWPINNHLRNQRLTAAGIDLADADNLLRQTEVEPLGLVSVDAAGSVKEAERSNEGRAIAIPMIMMMLLFMMIMVGATPLINAVLEEKMQRIAEVLLGSVRPFQLMVGKVLCTLGVSFTVIAIYLAGGLVVAQQVDAMDYVPFHVLPWFFVYMVAAVFLFGSVFMAIGAACNDLKEAQSLMMPVWLLVVVPMFVWLPVVKEPTSSFATGMSLIPPFTPMLMLLRQSTPGGIPAWQPWVGLIGILVCTTVCVWAAGRIFRVGILMQGKPPKLGELLRWAVRG
ncbi:MAG: ABC transporter permease [Planctomycetes bacterium]|nr:ABC transporter permease [Planctomycetota bacterium]